MVKKKGKQSDRAQRFEFETSITIGVVLLFFFPDREKREKERAAGNDYPKTSTRQRNLHREFAVKVS